MKWSPSLIVGLVLTIATLLVGLPLLAGQVLGGHDIVVYLINAQQMAEVQREGALFPTWAGGFNAGYGSPTLLFFPPLTTYIHATAVHLGVPVIVGVCFWSLAGLFFSGAAMFGWLRSAGLGSGALPGALVYMIAPYRVIDLYHRSALAEHWAFVWPPLILWAATTPGVSSAIRVPLLAFSVAALLLSNIPLALLFGVGLAVWFIFSKSLRGHRLEIAGAAVLGFAMSAFALVPQALSSSLLAVDQIYGPGAGRFRPSANTLFSGGFRVWDFNAQMSVLVVATFALILLTYFLASPEVKQRSGVRAAVVAAFICLLAVVRPAGIVWDVLPLFSKLQFPWRVASLLTFALAFLVAALSRRRAWLLVILIFMVSVSSGPWSRTLPFSRFSSPEPPLTRAGHVFPDPRTSWEAGSGGWYWRHETLAEIWFLAADLPPFLLPDLAGHSAHQLDVIRHLPAVMAEAPDLRIEVKHWGSLRREVSVDSPKAGMLVWRTVRFPSMKVTIDGEPVSISNDPKTGLLAHALPTGKHVVQLRWEAFPALVWARRLSLAGTVFSVVILLAAVIRSRAIRSLPSDA